MLIMQKCNPHIFYGCQTRGHVQVDQEVLPSGHLTLTLRFCQFTQPVAFHVIISYSAIVRMVFVNNHGTVDTVYNSSWHNCKYLSVFCVLSFTGIAGWMAAFFFRSVGRLLNTYSTTLTVDASLSIRVALQSHSLHLQTTWLMHCNSCDH